MLAEFECQVAAAAEAGQAAPPEAGFDVRLEKAMREVKVGIVGTYRRIDASHEAWKKLGYIEDRIEHMKYGEYRKQGLYIGSGLIESACRTDVARRCKQSGMHWRFKNAAYMCALVARFRSNLHAA